MAHGLLQPSRQRLRTRSVRVGRVTRSIESTHAVSIGCIVREILACVRDYARSDLSNLTKARATRTCTALDLKAGLIARVVSPSETDSSGREGGSLDCKTAWSRRKRRCPGARGDGIRRVASGSECSHAMDASCGS